MKKKLFLLFFFNLLYSSTQINSASAQQSEKFGLIVPQTPHITYYDPYSWTQKTHMPYSWTQKIHIPLFYENDSIEKVLETIKFSQRYNLSLSDEELSTIGCVIANNLDNRLCNVYNIVEILKLLPKSKCLDKINQKTGQAPIHSLARLHWIPILLEVLYKHTSGTVRTESPDFYPGSTFAAIVAGISVNHVDRRNHERPRSACANKLSHFINNAKSALESWFKQYPSCIGLSSSKGKNELPCWFILPKEIQLYITNSLTNQDKENIKKALEQLIIENKISLENVLKIFSDLSITQ